MIQSQLVTRILRKSTSALIASVIAIGLLASASRAHAQATFIWTNSSGNWNTTANWQTNLVTGTDGPTATGVTCGVTASNVTAYCTGGGNGMPARPDAALFTNTTNPTITINISTNLNTLTFFSNAVVTVNASGNSLNATGSLRIAQANFSTATVYLAGGTLSSTNGGPGNVAIGTGTNSLGTLIVTNGTLAFDSNNGPGGSAVGRGLALGGPAAAGGKLVVSSNGVVSSSATLVMSASGTGRSELTVTNGGQVFMGGLTQLSNSLVLVSGSTSIVSNSFEIACGSASGSLDANGYNTLIVSNGALVVSGATLSFGKSASSYNTAIVVNAGSRLISLGTAGNTLVISSSASGGFASSNNVLKVYDGGFINCGGGTFTMPASAGCANNTFLMGGTGDMSTGTANFVRYNSGGLNSTIVISNAVFSCSGMDLGGVNPTAGSGLSVLEKGTLIFTNTGRITVSIITNVLSLNNGSGHLEVNAGTINAVSGSNMMAVAIGGNSSGTPNNGNKMTISNGGKLLSELGTLGGNSSYCTGIVTGVGSVWSNFTAGGGYLNTNEIHVGGGTVAGLNSFNHLAIQNGALLFNNGSLGIGSSGSTTFNSVLFGGPGVPAVITNTGTIAVGDNSASTDNSLTVSNASVFVGLLKVRPTNSIVFAAGTISSQGTDIDPGANGSNEFVVGDGVDAAYFDMVAGGTGYHSFGSPGLVVTNGASLRGNGTITGTTTVLGTFAPGFSVGSMYFSNSLSFGNAATLNYDLGTSSDSVTVEANLKLAGLLNIFAATGFGTGDYTLFTYLGTLSPSSTVPSIGATPNPSLTYTIDTNTIGSVILHITAAAGDPYTDWATHYGLSGSNALGTADPDGDRMINTNEFLAGFNPTNNAAYVHVISIAKASTTNIVVTYLGASGDTGYAGAPSSRTNVLEVSPGTANGSFSNNFATADQTNILSSGSGLGTTASFVVTNGASSTTKYYRVRVLVP